MQTTYYTFTTREAAACGGGRRTSLTRRPPPAPRPPRADNVIPLVHSRAERELPAGKAPPPARPRWGALLELLSCAAMTAVSVAALVRLLG